MDYDLLQYAKQLNRISRLGSKLRLLIKRLHNNAPDILNFISPDILKLENN